jgi:general secretion pathway protein M
MNQLFVVLSRYNRREQMLLLAMGALVVIFLLWVLLLSPLNHKRNQVVVANTAATQTLGKVKLMAAQIQQRRDQGGQASSGDNINQLIDTSLRANGLAMTSFQPGAAGEVRVRLDSASYQPLLQWLYEIEYKHGVNVLDLTVAALNDPGQVSVSLRLRKAN